MEKSFRIHTNITGDTFVNVNMKQDFDFLEILSLKLRQKDAYRLHSSNYGVIVGRVLANDAFGIPNAKVSVFIERDTSDPNEMRDIYPYSEVMSKDSEGIRYNLLPDYSDDSCYRVVGTFPRKRYLLDDDVQLDVYDKYWKYTTVTNEAGDYMIFGVPAGSQQIHVDIDLSDIGILSQKPRDFIFKGHNIDEFDSPSQFKESTNLDGLQQIISQNKATVVYPFWGDPENGIAAITRCDVQVNYKFEPTCVFMGSIVSDNEGNSIGHKCAPSVDSGMNNQLVAGEGTIEMIRKTPDGLVEEFPINGNALIDSDGVWCYQIPMNLDFVGTDEYGNIVPTQDTSKGIPTRAQVRFRISKTESGNEGFSRHTAKYLVPMNPIMDETSVEPKTKASTGLEMERMYAFGSNTPQSCFRDLYWNNVYSVKNYIPKVQVAHRAYSTNYGALKGSNLVENQNPVPFNKLRVDIPFSFIIVCILFTIVMVIVHFINLLIYIIQAIRGLFIGFKIFGKRIGFYPFKLIIPKFGCIPLSAGLGDGSNVAYYPGCSCPNSEGCKNASCPEGMEGSCTKSSNNSDLKDKVQQSLALDYKIVKLDFYQDWLNGSLYMPLWYWRKRKKKSFLFLTISEAKNEYCSCDKEYNRLKTYVTCDIEYGDNSLDTTNSVPDSKDRWHKSEKAQIRYKNGLIKPVKNSQGLTAYYYVAYQPIATSTNIPIERRGQFDFAMLYATDIILLGNLNENNIYGIPQFFTSLPSTTANIPPIATVQESLTDKDNDSDSDNIEGSDDSGTTITTGMDWGSNGGDQTPTYKDGLFIDLACTYAATRAKSCINVERLSEFGVNMDSTYEMSYAYNSNDLKSGLMDSDGFINKLELEDYDNRATFATLNHVGFIPQDYQDSISGYTTQVQDENTGYLVPKFRYIYPVDFDGRLQPIMERYKKGFEQALYDERDQAYLTFRLGGDKGNKDANVDGRIRHFYHTSGSKRDMPVYNNSFYFYFGINKGNTAIDKFNKMFYAPCFQKDKKPFSFTVESMSKSYCPSMYGNTNKAYNGYGYIRFTSEDIIPPFSYTLYDSSSNVVVPTETGMTVTDFVIGGGFDEEGNVIINQNGIVKTQLTNEPVPNIYGTEGLINQTYVIEVTDANGRKIAERVELKVPKVSLNFEVESLKTKFYNTTTTKKSYICDEVNKFYGIIKITGFSVDGMQFFLTNSETATSSSSYLHGKSLEGYEATVYMKIGAVAGRVSSCMCDNWYHVIPTPDDERPKDDTGTDITWTKQVVMHVYQPNRFTLTLTQLCDNKETDNVSSDIATVLNGINFNAFLNTMPVKFMLGTTTDTTGATVANASRFYSSSVTTNPTDTHLSGWYGLHQEDTYRWDLSENQVLKKNQDMWGDFVDVGNDITRPEIKGKILEYKFNCMFSLASAAYIIDSSTTFRYEAVGGVTPTLYRKVAPKYADLEGMKSTYVLSDDNTATPQMTFPNIVGRNYSGQTNDNGPQFNRTYNNNDRLGNYFAAFTNNGGYTSKTNVDSSLKVVRIPSNAKVSPKSSEKKLGKDEEGQIAQFPQAYNASNPYQPYLRALTVDRRLDFDIILFAPCVASNSIRLYPDSESGKERIWKSARISGTTYNGVEMSYDSDYNIMSATVAEDGSSATPNKRLEYSYQYSSGDSDAKTIYNSEQNMIWEGDSGDDGTRQILKRFYEATFVGRDIRNYFWSTFNKTRLGSEATAGNINTTSFYVYKYPSTQKDIYNGDFNRVNVSNAKNYPTKRFIDVGNIEAGSSYDLNIANCSYAMTAHYNTDGTITSEVQEADGINVSTTFDNPITVLPANTESDDYANAAYTKSSTTTINSKKYFTFVTKTVSIMFTINPVSNDEFDVYNAVPKLIKVMPFKDNYDGISYIKTVTPNKEVAAKGSVNNAADAVTLHTFNKLSNDAISVIFNRNKKDTIAPSGTHIDDMQLRDGSWTPSYYYFKDDNGRVYYTSDSTDAQSITYFLNELDVRKNNVYMFAALIERQYISKNEDNLKKNLNTFEFSEIYDVRPIYIRFNSDGTSQDDYKSYVEVIKNEIVEEEETDTTEGDNSENDGEPVVTVTYTTAQTMTFELAFTNKTNPYERGCEAFGNTATMSYNLYLQNSNEDNFQLTPSKVDVTEVEGVNGGIFVSLSFRWTQEMGILADPQWRGNTKCALVGKTGSNFIYRLSWFNLKFINQGTITQNTEGKYKTEMDIL